MSLLAFDLIAGMLVLLFSPALISAHAFARRGDRMALRRLRFILPGQSGACALLLLWVLALEINSSSDVLLVSSLALGIVGALVSLLLHSLNEPS
jgi:hypothetical protein